MTTSRSRALVAISTALLSALFFTATYVLNRVAATGGGHWAWTASLRYFVTLPMLLPLMKRQGGVGPVWRAIAAHPRAWLTYALIGFVAFYLLLSFAAASGPSWLIAGSFQFTVVAGMLCAPFVYSDERRRVPAKAFAVALTILAGVLLMQLGRGREKVDASGWLALVCVLAAAVAYPLGNRLLLVHLEKTGEPLSATQRTFGLTLASQPAWLLVAAFAWHEAGSPPSSQIFLAAGVALFAGVIATILFFEATGMVRHDPVALGAAEAMQGAEPLFALVIGTVWLDEPWPSPTSLAGTALVTAGIAAFTWLVAKSPASS